MTDIGIPLIDENIKQQQLLEKLVNIKGSKSTKKAKQATEEINRINTLIKDYLNKL